MAWCGMKFLVNSYQNKIIVKPCPQNLIPRTPSPNPNQVQLSSNTQLRPRGLRLTLKSCRPPPPPTNPITFKHEGGVSQQNPKTKTYSEWLSVKKKSGGPREEGHRAVRHVQWAHHQSYLLHHYQNASIKARQIQCRKDQMQVSHVEKNIVKQSSPVPISNL